MHKIRFLNELTVVFKAKIGIEFNPVTVVEEISSGKIHSLEFNSTKYQAFVPGAYASADCAEYLLLVVAIVKPE